MESRVVPHSISANLHITETANKYLLAAQHTHGSKTKFLEQALEFFVRYGLDNINNDRLEIGKGIVEIKELIIELKSDIKTS